MSKIRSFPNVKVKKIKGGKNYAKLVQQFLESIDSDIGDPLEDAKGDSLRWMVNLEEGEDLEVLLENIKTPGDTTIYMGVNVVTIPLKKLQDCLIAALEIADGLIGAKISLVGHFLVLSVSMPCVVVEPDDLLYTLRLLTVQRDWFRDTLITEMGWEVEDKD